MVDTSGIFMGGVVDQRNERARIGLQERAVSVQERQMQQQSSQQMRAEATKAIEALNQKAKEIVANFPGTREEAAVKLGGTLKALADQANRLGAQAGIPLQASVEEILATTPTAGDSIALDTQRAQAITGAQVGVQTQAMRERIPIEAAQAKAVKAAQIDAELEGALKRQSLGVVADPEKQFDNAKDLRGEFTKETKVFVDVRDAYQRILASAENPSAAGDLALIFNYMKMLDPGSTVREGEFANAQNSGGVSQRVQAMYNSVLNGERLADSQRNDFLTRSQSLFSGQKQLYEASVERFTELAERYGVNPQDVVTDLTKGLNERATGQKSAEALPEGIPKGSKQIGTIGGKPVYEAPNGDRYTVED